VYFFDSHAHIHLARFADPQMRRIRMRRAHRAGVRAIVTSGVGPEDWSKALEISGAQRAPAVFCALGLHPYAVKEEAESNRRALNRLSELLELNAQEPDAPNAHVVALGECGLDFRKGMPFAPRQMQIECLTKQLDLAARLQLPCVIHCVRAHGTLIELLDAHPIVPSVMHAFSGSAEVAKALVARGHFISFAGNLTRADAKRLHGAARSVPADRLLVESDSPDQTPQARGAQANEPAFIVDTVTKLAQLRGESMAKLCTSTMDNARRVYRIAQRWST
jgi:TatD DNase family protein